MRIIAGLLACAAFMTTLAATQERFQPRVSGSTPPIVLGDAPRDTLVDVIVQFVEPPLLIARGEGARKVPARIDAALYTSRFAQFASDLNRSGVAGLASASRHEYSNLFFGAAVTVNQQSIETIERLPYVRRVLLGRVFTANLVKSQVQIRAAEARAAFGVRGEGVLVGIIDSGIDYLHPALGGGIGAGFKVVGGVDFVNADADPMDDNGHGTHVAGIVAADGVVEGIAPGARLLAFKALDAFGRGREADILAALDRIADPNQDGDPSDRPDIVNMSLGSDYGTSDDPVATAVDNGVRLGMTFCVSAGNAGRATPVQGKEDNYYFTAMESVGSPGTARLAITVGAVDSLDGYLAFSSKGPAGGTHGIKPDLLAPGAEILSLAPGGGLIPLSGTSMSSPMVAGIAALLKSRNHPLSPAEVKSAVVNTAIDLGLPVMKQGAGRVDAFRALATTTTADPAVLSFGVDDPATLVWTEVETLFVTNRNALAQGYQISAAGTGVGISLSASPSAFLLPPGGVQMVLMTIGVDNSAIPIVDEDILIRDGALRITGSFDTLHLPWAFLRTSRMLVAFSHPNPRFLGASETYSITSRYGRRDSKIHWLDATHLEAIGPFDGVYNFVVHYPEMGDLITRAGFSFQGSGSVTFDAAEAVHTLRFDGRDENGAPFPSSGKTQRTLRVVLPTLYPVFVHLPDGAASITVSPTPASFRFHPVESYADLAGAKRVVVPQYASFAGMSGDLTLTPSSPSYLRQSLRFRIPPGKTEAKFYTDVINVQRADGTDYFNTIQFAIDTVAFNLGETSFSLALMGRTDTLYSSSVAFHVNAGDLSADFLDYSTRYFSVVGESLLVGLPSQKSLISYQSPDGGSMTFGGGPVHLLNMPFNNILGTSVHFFSYFRGGLFEERYTDAAHGTFALYNEGGDKLAENPLDIPRSPISVAPGRYRLEIASSNYRVSNAAGKVSLTTTFDLAAAIYQPPVFSSFMVSNGAGTATDSLGAGDQGSLLFSAWILPSPDQYPVVDSTKAFYRRHRGANWLPLPVSHLGNSIDGVGGVYRASLAGATQIDTSGIDLRVRVVDPWGNASDMIVAPAFAVGNWVDHGPDGVEEDGGTAQSYALMQNYPNPFNPLTRIELRIKNSEFLILKVFDLLGREVATLLNERREPGKHVVEFDARGLASGVYFYRLQAGKEFRVRKMTLTR